MATNSSSAVARRGEWLVTLGLVAVVAFFLVTGIVTYANVATLRKNSDDVTKTHDIILSLELYLADMKDAETGQRGFMLTGDNRYLDPYVSATNRIEDRFERIRQLYADQPQAIERLARLKRISETKLNELAETIQVRRTKGFEAGLAIVLTDRGKDAMSQARGLVDILQQEARELRHSRIEEMQHAYRQSLASGVIASLLGVVLAAIVGGLIRRVMLAKNREDWLQKGKVELGNAMLGDQPLERLGDSALSALVAYTGAQAAVIYGKDGSEFRRLSTYGVPDEGKIPERFLPGEGLLGQVVKEKQDVMLSDVPEDYLFIGSALGSGVPRHLYIMPAITDEQVMGVLELGYFHAPSELTIDLLKSVSETIGVAVRSANYRAHLHNLLEETHRQAEELQTQSEELRVNNEELEEQSRALKESQVRLEQQQSELEQTNSQLEEQTQQLETQRDDLARARDDVQRKASDLERASQYKSDFLANMSHELRTPLNSSLILAKLLADNPQGNLTEEQVRFALTIQSAGNDLLALINDILDLSKIEAGHMDIRAETVSLKRLADDLQRVFDPLAKQKKLQLGISVLEDVPAMIETDRLRLEQVLKNLLANAIKFTHEGQVALTVIRAGDNKISFEVMDTGIGIPAEQQQGIFDAFRQADGTISRKYGGTGLGLSISRELVRLLGGTLRLASKHGEGSTFIVTLPLHYDEALVAEPSVPYGSAFQENPARVMPQEVKRPVIRRIGHIEDDREHLEKGKRTILIVEDDEPFARILFDLTHEHGFQCLVTHHAEDAIQLASQYLPEAVVLDVGLPDHSGLSVLDRLKQEPRTRHIPVHVVSAGDYEQTALSLGAVGYMLKPVKREQLVETLRALESRLEQSLRRVLVVEDDKTQMEAVCHLLSSDNVETIGVRSAAECLQLLQKETFDCMVLDLSLPDASGYSLLETLSREDAYSFPPVIVYTGRELSADEESKLRRYSKSIIIKGAKSPERLLDEVTLFLHKVVADLPAEQQQMLEKARNRDAVLEGRRILVVEDDVRNVYALSNILEPRGAEVLIARNGREAIEMLEASDHTSQAIDLVLMDVMMPEMDGMTATRLIRQRKEWKKLPVIMLTAKAMKDDQERCIEAGANDYMAKPLDVEKLLSLVRVWMPR